METDPHFKREEACISNISPSERRKRLMAGVAFFLAGLILLALMIGFGWNRLWRLALVLPFIGATYGYFQWREKT